VPFPPSERMNTYSANKALIQRYYNELWNTWNFALADELLAADISFRGSLGAEMRGREAFRCYMRQVQAAFPDFHNSIEQLVEESDHIVGRLTYSGTHLGEIFGVLPTGRQISYGGAAFFRIADRRIAQGWVLGDVVGLLSQLGVHNLP
jgi:steroid delta-isomerase-like uncharacterized protein